MKSPLCQGPRAWMEVSVVGIPYYIKALLDPRSYPGEHPRKVEFRQTHISYLFLTPRHVYKIKKPVNFGFLDFTTLEKRRKFSELEVRLNRRLARDVYLGVVDVTGHGGAVSFGGKGRVIDCAVKMKRLKDDTILEELVRKGFATADMIEKTALHIARFHRGAATNTYISGFGEPGMIARNTDENFSQTRDFIGRIIPRPLFERIRKYTNGFLRKNSSLFIRRVDGGFIKDCHGDIHLEHISIGDVVRIFDCIEFNERFRFSDTVSDTAFLSMDLDFHNRHDLSKTLDKAYFRATGDRDGKALMDFYRCYRAYVRGKVEGFKFLEPEVTGEEGLDAYINARRHFHLSGMYASGGFRPMLIIMRGLSGSGKSTVAEGLSKRLFFPVVSSDEVRKGITGVPPGEHVFEEFGKGIYSGKTTERTYREVINRGVKTLKAGRSVILDATFSGKRHLKEALDKARGAGVQKGSVHIIECRAKDSTVKERLQRRLDERFLREVVSDMRWEIYMEQKRSYEPVKGISLVLHAEDSAEDNIKGAVNAVFG